MPDVNVKCVSHSSRKNPVAATELRIQRQKIANNSHQLAITNIPTEINPEVLGRVRSVSSNATSIAIDDVSDEQRKEYVVQLRAKKQKADSLNERAVNANKEDGKEIRLKESLDASGELLEAMDSNKYERELKRCRNECEREDIRSAYTEASQVLIESSESYIEQSAKLTDGMEMHPEKTNENKIKDISIAIAGPRKLLTKLKKNMEALKSIDLKLSISLKTLKEKTDKLIGKLNLISAKFEELKKKYFDKKNNELIGPNEDDEHSEGRKYSISKNLTDAFVDGLLEQDKTEKKEAREKLDNLAVQKKKEEETAELLFEKIIQENKEKLSLNLRLKVAV